jgi:hypothetical protein
MNFFKCKISRDQITYGPITPTEEEAKETALELMQLGYRKTSNAHCMVSRIDREDWLDVLAKERRCSRADFYNVDGSGVGDQHRDHYIRVFSRDNQTVAPEVIRFVKVY